MNRGQPAVRDVTGQHLRRAVRHRPDHSARTIGTADPDGATAESPQAGEAFAITTVILLVGIFWMSSSYAVRRSN